MPTGGARAETDVTASDRLDRHALVMALWIPAGLLVSMLLHLGMRQGGAGWIAAGFALLIVTFVGHIIVNVLLQTVFSPGETALGGVIFAVALISLLIAWLVFADRFSPGTLMLLGLGLASLIVTVILYLVIAYGPRKAFGKFDVIRDNNLRPASRLPHRGGRR